MCSSFPCFKQACYAKIVQVFCQEIFCFEKSSEVLMFWPLHLNCDWNVCFPQDESEFRDKLTPITIFMEYRLDYRTAADATGLHPILNQFTPANMSRQVPCSHSLGSENSEHCSILGRKSVWIVLQELIVKAFIHSHTMLLYVHYVFPCSSIKVI